MINCRQNDSKVQYICVKTSIYCFINKCTNIIKPKGYSFVLRNNHLIIYKNILMGNFKVGDQIPSFSAVIEDGSPISSESIKGKKTIIFFYPKDDSPTCTKEACNLRDNYKIFERNGYTIYGLSPDTDKKHKKFIDKYELPYSLISDSDKSILNAFGFFGPKIFMGKEVTGVYRTTVVIDENGVLSHIIEDVVSGNHSQQLADALGIK